MRQKRCLLVQVVNPEDPIDFAERNMRELEQLVATFGGEVVTKIVQHRINPHPATYIGSGKLVELTEIVKLEKTEIVIFEGIVKASQLFRVEKRLWQVNPQIRVWDKVDLILAIFDKHATTVEAKLQIELARINHLGPRSYGLGGGELSRQGGGIGTRGKGETNIEFERRVVRRRRQEIQQKLKKVTQQKQGRVQRRSELGLGPVALVGYTSAGKTTLFNALTGKQKTVSKQLFTTLDTVVGKMKAPRGNLPVIISDTIGFIHNLPPDLIEAFQSTLLESLTAKIILHVVDIRDPEFERNIEVVDEILAKMMVTQPVLLVGNKIDGVSKDKRVDFRTRYQDREHILVSAVSGEGLQSLKDDIWKILSVESAYTSTNSV